MASKGSRFEGLKEDGTEKQSILPMTVRIPGSLKSTATMLEQTSFIYQLVRTLERSQLSCVTLSFERLGPCERRWCEEYGNNRPHV